jgi:arginase
MAVALRKAGIVRGLAAQDAGAVEAPPYQMEWPAEAGVRHGPAIANYSVRLARRLGRLIKDDTFVVVLGGDCSIVLGPTLALRRSGRYGLIFADGHLDFRHPGNGEVTAAAGEDLALVTGRGDAFLTNLGGQGPLVDDANVVAFAFREGPRAAGAMDILHTQVQLMDLADVRRAGVDAAAAQALAYLVEREVDGIWLHVDTDVLDSRLMPAVDSPQPDGLRYEELVRLLQVVRASPSAVGVDFTIFDPDLDPDGNLAHELTTAICAGLTL